MHLLENVIFKAKASIQSHWFSHAVMKRVAQLEIKTTTYLNKAEVFGELYI